MPENHVTDLTKPLICFIDDSAKERELFEEVFGSDDGAFRVICAETFEEARSAIEELDEMPDLFVLDLYFPTGEKTDVTVESIGPITLPDDKCDLTQAFLNVETAHNRFREIRDALGQSPAGGLKLIERVQDSYPGVPMVTYTRKGTIEEAEQARRAGARRVLQKPSGEDWEATRRLTKRLQRELENRFRWAMGQDPYEILNLIVHYSGLLGSRQDLSEVSLEVQALRRRLERQPNAPLGPDDVDRLMECTNHPFIRALIYQLSGE